MAGALAHSPADVTRRVLIQLGLGVAPTQTASWGIYATQEPPTPDNVITIYNTAGRDHGRVMVGGQRQKHYGIQVRVRAKKNETGFAKAQAIAIAMDEAAYDEYANLDDQGYVLHCFANVGDVIDVGYESPTSKRNLFTINALVALRQL